MWGYRTCRVDGVRALVRPSHPHVGLLFRVWATPPTYGTGGPRAGQAARVWDRQPACERRGAGLHQARRNARKPVILSLGLLIRTWACCSESGQPRPRAGQAARVRDTLESKLFCPGARGRRPAREIATREPAARSDRSRSPARPCRRPRAPILPPGTNFAPGAKQPQCLTGVESQNDRKCAGDGSFHAR